MTLKGETCIGALSRESNASFEIIFLRGRRLFRNDCLAFAAGISDLILTGENGLLESDKMQGKVMCQVNMSGIPSGGKPWRWRTKTCVDKQAALQRPVWLMSKKFSVPGMWLIWSIWLNNRKQSLMAQRWNDCFLWMINHCQGQRATRAWIPTAGQVSLCCFSLEEKQFTICLRTQSAAM